MSIMIIGIYVHIIMAHNGDGLKSIGDHFVNVHNVFLYGAPLEHFPAHRTLEFRQHATLELHVPFQSFLVLVRPAASVRAH